MKLITQLCKILDRGIGTFAGARLRLEFIYSIQKNRETHIKNRNKQRIISIQLREIHLKVTLKSYLR